MTFLFLLFLKFISELPTSCSFFLGGGTHFLCANTGCLLDQWLSTHGLPSLLRDSAGGA